MAGYPAQSYWWRISQESEDKYLSFSGLADMDGSGAEEEINKLTQLADKINHQISTEEPQVDIVLWYEIRVLHMQGWKKTPFFRWKELDAD